MAINLQTNCSNNSHNGSHLKKLNLEINIKHDQDMTIISHKSTSIDGSIILKVKCQTTAEEILKYLKENVVMDYTNELNNFDFYLESNQLNINVPIFKQNILPFKTLEQTQLITLKLKIDHDLKCIIINDISRCNENYNNGNCLKKSFQNFENTQKRKKAKKTFYETQSIQNSQKSSNICGNIVTIKGVKIEETTKQILKYLKKNNFLGYENMLDNFQFYLNNIKLNDKVSLLKQCNLISKTLKQTQEFEVKLVINLESKQIKIIDVLMLFEDKMDDEQNMPSTVVQNSQNCENMQGTSNPVDDTAQETQPSNEISNYILPTQTDKTLENDKSKNGAVITWPFSNQPQSNHAANHQIQLWEFLLELLTDVKYHNFIQWTGVKDEFKLLDAGMVAQLWGQRKLNQTMNYDKLARGLRYYYQHGILEKVSGRKFCYKFVCDLKAITGYDSTQLNAKLQDILNN